MKPKLLFIIGLIFLSACNLETSTPADLLTRIPNAKGAGNVIPRLTPQYMEEVSSSGLKMSPTPLPGYGPFDFPKAVNPLTGLKVEDPEILNRRPVSVKVNNYPRGDRPQWGLSLADIVYEYYHNNELPRFNAIFYGQDADMVGPIRSARPFDDYLVQIYQSNFVFAKADYRVMERLTAMNYADRLIFNLSGLCPPFPVCRVDPGGKNSLVTNTSIIGPYLQETGVINRQPNLNGMWFNETAPAGGEKIKQAFLRISYSAYFYWKYDADTKLYYRFQDTREDFSGNNPGYAPLTDRLNGDQVSAANVVFLVVPHFHIVYKPPANGNPAVEIVDMKFTGSGKAYALRDGKGYELEWVRSDSGGVIYLVYSDGSRYPFKPGNTWFQVITVDTRLNEEENIWRFNFIFTPKVK